MATTTPDNLWSPDPNDPYNLTVDLAHMQATTQTALTNRKFESILRVKNVTERAALVSLRNASSDPISASSPLVVFRADIRDVEYTVNGTKWYRTDDTIIPSSIQGGTVDPTSGVIQASGTSGSLRILDCFSGDYNSYTVVARLTTPGAFAPQTIRLIQSTGGADYTGSYFQGAMTSGGVGVPLAGMAATLSQWETSAVTSRATTVQATVITPSQTDFTQILFSSGSYNGATGSRTGHVSIENNTSFSGLAFYNSQNSNFTGTVQIKGIA